MIFCSFQYTPNQSSVPFNATTKIYIRHMATMHVCSYNMCFMDKLSEGTEDNNEYATHTQTHKMIRTAYRVHTIMITVIGREQQSSRRIVLHDSIHIYKCGARTDATASAHRFTSNTMTSTMPWFSQFTVTALFLSFCVNHFFCLNWLRPCPEYMFCV